ncbi:TetR/AcrR family transcriptional regulator [Dyadobacter jejuensis]|uniref:TetR/AcrR family transcriptional regulator n=1 Tax=Dyadobacter jejuensis TaxID=1082580 RepID=UPI001E3B5815|nr:TetR family transcriptional regulator [Dyadobacter jejuensis]
MENTSTEEKIVAAAHKLFTQKGYAATKTRDIAEEAGINLALLNYYFRSKEKLFELIMADNLKQFLCSIESVTTDARTTYQEKFKLLVENYIDLFLDKPDMPIFILSEIRSNPLEMFQRVRFVKIFEGSIMSEQLREAIERREIEPINPVHILMNLLGMVVFPFVVKPIIQNVVGVEDANYREMMLVRKKMIPLWVEAMLQVKAD